MKNTTNENGEASEASQLKENLMKSVDVARSRLGRYLIRLVQISRFMFSVTRWDVAEAFNHVRMNKWVFPLVLFRPRAILFICFGATQHLIETKRPLKRDCGAGFKKKKYQTRQTWTFSELVWMIPQRFFFLLCVTESLFCFLDPLPQIHLCQNVSKGSLK